MKNYTVTMRYVTNISIDVQAEDHDQAEALAWTELQQIEGDDWLHEGEWTETFITEHEDKQ